MKWPTPVVLRRTLLVCILVYAALLRFEALTLKWGPVSGPPVLRAAQTGLQAAVSRLRPRSFGWEPEPFLLGDPYDDLQNARDMRWFYWAGGREPVFTFATQILQRVVGDREAAVCIASGLFSLLMVWGTYLVGARAFTPWVGLGAAAGMAIERDVIGQGSIGFKDEAFGFFLLLSAYGFLRLRAQDQWKSRLISGLAMGGTCLNRLTGLSFVLPTLAYVSLCADGRPRLTSVRSALAAGVIAAAVLAPFLATSWIEFGDPLYALNSRTAWYEDSLERPVAGRAGTGQFLRAEARRSPVAFVDTALNGLVTYPLTYKWAGFDPWLPGLGRAISWLSAVGLVLFLWTAQGRLLLLIMFSSMVPYIFTWQVPNFSVMNHFRYTQHVYPILLLAAAFTADSGIAVARPDWLRQLVADRALWNRIGLRVAATVALAALGWSAMTALGYLRLQEDLRLRGGAIVYAGSGDRLFFRSGWYRPRTVGHVTARFAYGRSATVWVPMLAGRAHRVTLRADPYVSFDGPLQQLGVSLNGVLLKVFPMTIDPERVGEYVVDVPGHLVTRSFNRLEFRSSYATRLRSLPQTDNPLDAPNPSGFDAMVGPDDEVAFRLWAVVITPR